jgi:DNA-3-methyladenine glycosylase II
MKPHRHLLAVDDVLAVVIKQHHLAALEVSDNYFQHLVDTIISQQLSSKVATVILNRFIKLFRTKTFPTPRQVLNMSDDKIRAVGISHQKIAYIKDLAAQVAKKEIDFQKINQLSDEDVIVELIKVKGIGRWTAEMFLMFALGRQDVFSNGDYGLQKAIQKLYKLKKLPDKKTTEKISNRWKPYRTLACRYLWASLDNG